MIKKRKTPANRNWLSKVGVVTWVAMGCLLIVRVKANSYFTSPEQWRLGVAITFVLQVAGVWLVMVMTWAYILWLVRVASKRRAQNLTQKIWNVWLYIAVAIPIGCTIGLLVAGGDSAIAFFERPTHYEGTCSVYAYRKTATERDILTQDVDYYLDINGLDKAGGLSIDRLQYDEMSGLAGYNAQYFYQPGVSPCQHSVSVDYIKHSKTVLHLKPID